MDNERDALDRRRDILDRNSIIFKPTYEELSIELALCQEELLKAQTLKDVDDKQWYIELEAIRLRELELANEKLITDARILEAKAVLAEAEATKAQVKANDKSEHALEVTCSSCGSEFKYNGTSAEIMKDCYEKFCSQHLSCT